MSDAIMLDVADATPVRLDVGDADPIAREEIAALAGRVTTVEGDVTALDGRMDAAEGEISTLGTTVDGIDARVEAIEADYVTSEDMDGLMSGHNPSLSAGSATGITGDVETSSWMARQTHADGAALIESVKGNTLRWNQLITVKARTSTAANVNYTGNADGTVTISGTASAADVFNLDSSNPVPVIQGHKYVIRGSNTEKHVLIIVPNLFTYGNPDVIHTATDTAHNQPASIYFAASFTGEYTCKPQIFDLTAMFGAGNEPATVDEFEALFPLPYYPYDTGTLLPVRMEGIETVGFNQWDEQWEVGMIAVADGQNIAQSNAIRSKDYNSCFPGTDYYIKATNYVYVFWYDAGKNYISNTYTVNNVHQSPANAAYFRIRVDGTTTYNHDICINLSDTSRNGTYEPYWSAQRAIAASTYFPDGMRSAGTVRDELTNHEAIHRVGEYVVDGNCNITARLVAGDNVRFTIAFPEGKDGMYNGSQVLLASNGAEVSYDYVIGHIDVAARDYVFMHTTGFLYTSAAAGSACKTLDEMKAWFAAHPLMLHYALATPTTTPIDPPLPMSYRVGKGGTERVMVAEGTTSAPPIFATRYPLDPADLAASIAPVDGPTATTNHQVGDLLMLGFTLCKATQVIVTGETIAIGTNVTRTTVAAELAALSE